MKGLGVEMARESRKEDSRGVLEGSGCRRKGKVEAGKGGKDKKVVISADDG